LIRIGLGVARLKLWQRLVKLALQSDMLTLPFKPSDILTTPCLYPFQKIAGYHTISHHFIIWVIFHAKACFTPPTQTKVRSAHIQTGKR
jgi:hypothetical protein